MADAPQSFGPGWDGDIIRSYLSERVEDLVDEFQRTASEINARCRSEIERRLAHHLTFMSWGEVTFSVIRQWEDRPSTLADLTRHSATTLMHSLDAGSFGVAVLGFQIPIGPYKADMALVCHSVFEEVAPFTVVIECDGHAYHERTKEQAAHDKQRDRYMQCAGFTVLRFTGSEIYQKGDDHAFDVWSYVSNRLSNVSRREVA